MNGNVICAKCWEHCIKNGIEWRFFEVVVVTIHGGSALCEKHFAQQSWTVSYEDAHQALVDRQGYCDATNCLYHDDNWRSRHKLQASDE